jgi:hypothetical protein
MRLIAPRDFGYGRLRAIAQAAPHATAPRRRRPASHANEAATHAAAAAHLARQWVPTQARLQDEENARKHRTIVERLAPRITNSPWLRRRQQRFDECRKVVEYQLGHILFVVETMKK